MEHLKKDIGSRRESNYEKCPCVNEDEKIDVDNQKLKSGRPGFFFLEIWPYKNTGIVNL